MFQAQQALLQLPAALGLGRPIPQILRDLLTLALGPAPVERLADTINYETVAAAARAIVAEKADLLWKQVETQVLALALTPTADPGPTLPHPTHQRAD